MLINISVEAEINENDKGQFWAVSGRAKILRLLRHENLHPVPSAVSNTN